MRKAHGLFCLLLCLLLAAGGRVERWADAPEPTLSKGGRVAAARFTAPHQEGELTAQVFAWGGSHIKTPAPDGAAGAPGLIPTASPALHIGNVPAVQPTHAAKAYLLHIHPSHHFW